MRRRHGSSGCRRLAWPGWRLPSPRIPTSPYWSSQYLAIASHKAEPQRAGRRRDDRCGNGAGRPGKWTTIGPRPLQACGPTSTGGRAIWRRERHAVPRFWVNRSRSCRASSADTFAKSAARVPKDPDERPIRARRAIKSWVGAVGMPISSLPNRGASSDASNDASGSTGARRLSRHRRHAPSRWRSASACAGGPRHR